MEHVRVVSAAAETGNLDALQKYIDNGEVHCVDEEGSTPLMYAAANGQEKVVRQLVQSGVDVDQQNHYGWTALLQASCYGHHEVVYTLLKHQADINLCNSWGTTPLVAAAQGGFATVVQELLEAGPEVGKEDEVPAITPLMAASQCGHEAIVTKLLAHGSNVNTRLMATGWTALMLAALNNQEVVVKLLLRHGAMREMKDVNGNRAVDLASSLGHRKVASLLAEDSAAAPSGVDIFEAVRLGNTELLGEILKRNRGNANVSDKDSATPLMYATRIGNKEMVQLLLDAGADVDVQEPIHGWTAFMQATHHKHYEVACLLAERGANVTLRAKSGSNAFDIATLIGDPAMIQLIASATIQRLKQKKTASPKKKLSTLSEEEPKADEGDSGKKSRKEEEEVETMPVSTEIILHRWSNAFLNTEEPLLKPDSQDMGGFMSPRRASPAPPSPSAIHPEPVPQPAVHSSPKPSKGQQPSAPNTDAPLPKVPLPKVKSPPLRRLPSKLQMPPRPNFNARSTPPILFPKNSPLPKSPQSLPANPFQFMKSNSRPTLKEGALLQRGRVPPSFLQPSQRNAAPSGVDLPSTPKAAFIPRRRSSVEVVKSPVFPIPRPRSATGPAPTETKKMGKRPSFSKLKLSSKGPGLKEVLASASLSQYWTIFEKEEMDLQSFLTLSEQELEEVGVEDEQDRTTLLSLISHLKNKPINKSQPTAGTPSDGFKFTFQ